MDAGLAGILAGLLHVVSGPDHLIAVAPLAMKRPLAGLRIGLVWGMGHASGVLVVGALGVVLRTFIDVQVLSDAAEFVVGFVLVGVGIWALSQTRRVVLHQHPHHHPRADESTFYDDVSFHRKASEPAIYPRGHHESHLHSSPPEYVPAASHEHLHVHTPGLQPPSSARAAKGTGRATFLVGLVHGAAGTGHLLGVLPSLALPPLQGTLYLVAYGIAAISAMAGFGLTVGLIGKRLRPTGLRAFMLASGVVAILLGLFWLYDGFVTLRR